MAASLESVRVRLSEMTGLSLQEDVLLGDHSGLRIGGTADLFLEARSTAEIVRAVGASRELSLSHYIIGGGYNILFDDSGFRGLIIKNRAEGVRLLEGTDLEIVSGTAISQVVAFCSRQGLTGLEFLAGIPGTTGGAVFGNAGAFGDCIGNHVREVSLLDRTQKEEWASGADMEFGYRRSRLKECHQPALRVRFRLRHGARSRIQARIEDILERRNRKHPWTAASAGSYFKNPEEPGSEKRAAAFLLDQVGAKGLRRGGAVVSSVHANFIVNEGGATAGDVLGLAEELKKRVFERFGIRLQEEVIHLPAGTSMP